MSGPLNVAMAYGIPVVLTRVGGLLEAASDYAGALFVPPKDPHALRDAIRTLPPLVGRRFEHPHSWARIADRYEALFDELEGEGGARPNSSERDRSR